MEACDTEEISTVDGEEDDNGGVVICCVCCEESEIGGRLWLWVVSSVIEEVDWSEAGSIIS